MEILQNFMVDYIIFNIITSFIFLRGLKEKKECLEIMEEISSKEELV